MWGVTCVIRIYEQLCGERDVHVCTLFRTSTHVCSALFTYSRVPPALLHDTASAKCMPLYESSSYLIFSHLISSHPHLILVSSHPHLILVSSHHISMPASYSCHVDSHFQPHFDFIPTFCGHITAHRFLLSLTVVAAQMTWSELRGCEVASFVYGNTAAQRWPHLLLPHPTRFSLSGAWRRLHHCCTCLGTFIRLLIARRADLRIIWRGPMPHMEGVCVSYGGGLCLMWRGSAYHMRGLTPSFQQF